MSKVHTTPEIKIMPEKWNYAPHVLRLENSIIREILKISSKPGVISFAGGLPAPEMFPLEDLKQSAVEMIDEFGSDSMQYSLSMGISHLRKVVAERETRLGSPTKMENILITTGSQQGIDLCARAFIDPGDYIITEYPTYVGALQAFNFYQTRYASVEMDENGMIVEQVEKAIKKYKPKFIYTVSNFQNPTGITMSEERRRTLVEIASKYNIPIVDDNPYGEIRFTGKAMPSLKDIGGEAVISLGTFSKILAPGLRIAWINASEKAMPIFERVKQCADLNANTFTQYMIYGYMRNGKLDGHIETIKNNYATKKDLMLREMANNFPKGISWTKPEGGLFLWVTLPSDMSAKKLFDKAIEQKVAYVYGKPFYPDGNSENTMRLNYCTASMEMISEGIKRLAKLLRDNMPR
ncbi:MAG: PLP-dependent aminotransferase family protein [candidate division Zixibacteria bacterium]|nr:PLP-dependent aminotransferase family protein [candidate division Zixibacteria bacterium]